MFKFETEKFNIFRIYKTPNFREKTEYEKFDKKSQNFQRIFKILLRILTL